MKNSLVTDIARTLVTDLKEFARICENVLSLAAREHQALAGPGDYQCAEFSENRKTLLVEIETMMCKFRNHRITWQQIPKSERERFTELNTLFQGIQGLLMKVLVLDRENQGALLKRGLVPVKHLPGVTARQPHYVADLYRRNSSS
jgi:hypothetical protein